MVPFKHLSRILPEVLSQFTTSPTLTMATDLSRGCELLVSLAPGGIVAFKSKIFDLSGPGWEATHLKLYNQNGEITLRISIRGGQAHFNDRAAKSLLDGWGEEQSVDLDPVDVDRWKRSGVTISVHDCSTHSSERYQILFNLTTMLNFNKRFPGPATKVVYRTTLGGVKWPIHLSWSSHLSHILKVLSYNLNDLPLEEKNAIESGRFVCFWDFFFSSFMRL